jgi:hypothetical protein
MKAMSKAKVQFALLLAVAVLGGMGISCKKDQPTQPPSQPGHTALTLQATFTSIRWCRLEWNNDSTAPSHRYLLVRNGRDTVFNDTVAVGVNTAVVQDTALKPGTDYLYWLFRIVNGAHWDSASVGVRTLDTSSSAFTWQRTVFGTSGDGIGGIWAASPQSIWICGTIKVVNIKNGLVTVYDTTAIGIPLGCYGTSDSNVWFADQNTLERWNGRFFEQFPFTGLVDTLPNWAPIQFNDIWVTDNGMEVFAVGGGGAIVHRKADGRTWELMKSPTALRLVAVRGFSASDVYAAGGYSNIEGVLLHYDGNSWTEILDSRPPRDSICNVGNILCIGGKTSDSLCIAGNGLFTRSGTNWKDASPQKIQFAYLEGVFARGWNDVAVCGDFGTLMHFDGEKWKLYDQFYNVNSSMVFRRIYLSDHEIFIVGSDVAAAYLFHGTR